MSVTNRPINRYVKYPPISINNANEIVSNVPMSKHSVTILREYEQEYHASNSANWMSGKPFNDTPENRDKFRELLAQRFQRSYLSNGNDQGTKASSAFSSKVVQELFDSKRKTGSAKSSGDGAISDIITGKKGPADEGCTIRYFPLLSFTQAYNKARSYEAGYLKDYITDYIITNYADIGDNSWWYGLYFQLSGIPPIADAKKNILRMSIDINKSRYDNITLEVLAGVVRLDGISSDVRSKLSLDFSIEVIPSPHSEGYIDVYIAALSGTQLDIGLMESWILTTIHSVLTNNQGTKVKGITGISSVSTKIINIGNTPPSVVEVESNLARYNGSGNINGYAIGIFNNGVYYPGTADQQSLANNNNILVKISEEVNPSVNVIRSWRIIIDKLIHYRDGISLLDIIRVLCYVDSGIIVYVHDYIICRDYYILAALAISNPKRYRLSGRYDISDASLDEVIIYTNNNPLATWSNSVSILGETEINNPDFPNPIKVPQNRTYGRPVISIIYADPDIDRDRLLPSYTSTIFSIYGIEMTRIILTLMLKELINDINPSYIELIINRKTLYGFPLKINVNSNKNPGVGPVSSSIRRPLEVSYEAGTTGSYEGTDTAIAQMCLGIIRKQGTIPPVDKDVFGRPILPMTVNKYGPFEKDVQEVMRDQSGMLDMINDIIEDRKPRNIVNLKPEYVNFKSWNINRLEVKSGINISTLTDVKLSSDVYRLISNFIDLIQSI